MGLMTTQKKGIYWYQVGKCIKAYYRGEHLTSHAKACSVRCAMGSPSARACLLGGVHGSLPWHVGNSTGHPHPLRQPPLTRNVRSAQTRSRWQLGVLGAGFSPDLKADEGA